MTESQLDQSLPNMPEPTIVDSHEDLPMAAALAAALVEYQQYKKHRSEDSKPANGNAGWRTVTRIEQLAQTGQRGLRGQM
jgi:hypothetical protein